MQIENEIKILDIHIGEAERLLQKLGYVRQGSYEYKRYVYDMVPAKKNAWIRLRTDGHTATLTFKESIAEAIDGMKEIEIVVDDFDKTNELLKAAGLTPRGYQENKRINYTRKGVTVSLDSWPQIPPYLEIEGDTADTVKRCLDELAGLITTKTTSLPTEEVYKHYGIDLESIVTLKFK